MLVPLSIVPHSSLDLEIVPTSSIMFQCSFFHSDIWGRISQETLDQIFDLADTTPFIGNLSMIGRATNYNLLPVWTDIEQNQLNLLPSVIYDLFSDKNSRAVGWIDK